MVLLGWWVGQPAESRAAGAAADCSLAQPDKLHVTSRLAFHRQRPDFIEVEQTTSIWGTEQQWGADIAEALTLSAESPKYREAMRCLLTPRGHPPEWQTTSPQATKHGDRVTLHYESWNLIDSAGRFTIGPWTVDVRPDHDWKAALQAPRTLTGASWERIEVDPGGLGISAARPAGEADIDRHGRAWKNHPPPVEARLVPPQDFAPQLSPHVAWIGSLGIVSWWISASGVIATSAWRFRRKAEGTPEKAATRALTNTVLQWAGLSAALGLTLLLLLRSSSGVHSWRALIVIASGLALVLLAKPWSSFMQGADDSRNGIKARHAIVASTTSAAALGLLVIAAPHLFGLEWNLTPTVPPTTSAIVGLVLLNLSALWLWLTAIAAWAWRFASEGKLGGAAWGSGVRHPLRRIAVIGSSLAVLAALLVACRLLAFEFMWERADWLGQARALFGSGYTGALGRQLADFASRGPQWVYAYTWMLTGIALVALLHSSSRTRPDTSLGPQGVDLLLVTGVFAIIVALRSALFAGSVAALYGLWLPLNMAALYAMVKVGRRWSVLGRVSHKAEKDCVVAELSTPAGTQRLMDDARKCRDLLHQLHLVDHGRKGDADRHGLEEQLRSLHDWRPGRCRHNCLPDSVSMVDVALGWGPHPRWWENALNAARWAALFGILPSMVTAWYAKAYGPHHWAHTLNSPVGIPDTAGTFLAQEMSFAGAGLVLGALWRVLPGERGPVRAFYLFVAWLVPIGVVAGLDLGIGHQQLGEQVLSIILMLMVLTLTSMWMDTDTFSRERPYWMRRLGLLASIYHVHGLSGQLAFLFAQLVAVVTIWSQIIAVTK
ncbi:DUF6185 family protein [Streptomyces mashuensis]|uniref:DUF6185 family protein n=1 Tax=Streptomyces mashuensis TaxID=33904 RepID=UPI00167C68F0|nr:DUF6185 family protein [Streptomyces mashuensis]